MWFLREPAELPMSMTSPLKQTPILCVNCSLQQLWTNRINIAKEEIDEVCVFVVYSYFSIANPALTYISSDSGEIEN